MLEDDEKLTFTKEEKRELLRQFRRLEKMEEENRELKKELEELREENRKLNDEIKRMKSAPQMHSSSGATAEAGGVPSSRIFYRRLRQAYRKPGG